MSDKIDRVYTAEQIRKKKLSKRGIGLNLLLIGENGIGKRSFINTLCKEAHYTTEYPETEEFSIATREISVQEDESIPIRLRVAMTVNYGYNMENSGNSEELARFVDAAFQSVLDEELKVDRNPRLPDARIHVALHFIRPTGRGLNELEVATMKKLGPKVNLVPVLAMADSMLDEDLEINRRLVNQSVREHGIQIYNFAGAAEYADEAESEFLSSLHHSVPFTVINANTPDFKQRTTRWGVVDIEDHHMCDMAILKAVLLGSHIEEFKDATIAEKYEVFRLEKLSA